jgi:hypothetical protein
MYELDSYLHNAKVENLPFAQDELSEPLLSVYNFAKWTLRDWKKKRLAALECTNTSVIWIDQKSRTVDQFNCPFDPRIYFKRVLDRDQMIRKYFKVVYESDQTMRIELTLKP